MREAVAVLLVVLAVGALALEVGDDAVDNVAKALPHILEKAYSVAEDVPLILGKFQDTAEDAPVSLGDESSTRAPSSNDASRSEEEAGGGGPDVAKTSTPLPVGTTTEDAPLSVDARAMTPAAEDVSPGPLGIAVADKSSASAEPSVLETQPAEALLKARQTLQRTLDQVLREAEQWAQSAQVTDDPEYYDEAPDAEVINKTRAELQRTLESMLTEAQNGALIEAMAEDEDNAVPEYSSTWGPVAARTSTEGVREVPDDGLENQLQDRNEDLHSSTPSTGMPSTVEAPTVGTETASSTSSSTTTTTPSTTTPAASMSASTASPATTITTTEENEYRHLVVPLGEANGEANGEAIILGATDTRRVDVPEDIVESAVAAAAALQAGRRMSTMPTSDCPTKQPAPLRLPALPNAAPDSSSPQCARDSRLLDLHARNHTLWAVQMQDAGAGGVAGLLEGNVYHLGDFDECMDVLGPVGAQYCVAEVRMHTPPRTPDHKHHPDFPPDPMQSVWNRIKHEGEAWRLPLDTLYVAVCAPASCGPRDLQDNIQRALDAHARCNNLPVAFVVSVSETLCTSASKQRPPFSAGEVAYIVIATLLGLTVLGGTLLDHFATNKKSNMRWLLVLFSLKRSWVSLLRQDAKPMGLDLDPLAGARTLNMLMLVVAHRGFNLMRGPVHNYNQYEAMPRALLQTGATHAQLFVDTCFAMSGLLLSLLELTRAHAHGKNSDTRVPLMAATVHRYMRLTPSYAMVVFFYASVFWRLGSGPLWDQVIGHESEACAKYWWTNMFYVNNYINAEKLCMLQSWYLPCDLHLFFVGSVLTLVLSRHRRTGLGLMLAFLVLSMLVPFFVTLLGRKPALLEMLPNLFRAPDQSDNFRTMYAPTHIRAAPYMVGLLAGYLFQRLALRHRERFTQGVTWLLCLGGVALTTASLLSSVVFYDPDMSYNGVAAGLYAALCPVAWSVGVCLVFAGLVLGSRTIMASALSWKPLVVLSRLTYNVYLTHWAFQIASVAKARTPFHLDPYNVFFYSAGDLLVSFLISLVLFLFVEAPFRSLARSITAAPPESIVHIQAAQDRVKSSALEAGFTGALPKLNK